MKSMHVRVRSAQTLLHTIVLVCFPFVALSSDAQINRVERFIRFTEIDPLYAWPGVNLQHMRRAISALESSREEIIGFAERQYSLDQVERIARSLYPTDFLSEMIALETKRRKLRDTADETGLAAYQKQLSSTIRTHRSYVRDLKSALEITAAEQTYSGLEFHFGQSTYAHFIFGISLYLKEIDESLKRANDRWACLKEQSVNCGRAVWFVDPLPESAPFDFSVFRTPSARITKAIRFRGPLGGQALGPGFAVLRSSSCRKDLGAVPYLLWEIPTASGVSIFRPEVISDVLVHDHRIDGESNGYERLLDALGMDGFLFQPQTNIYACPDAAGDDAALRAMASTYAFASTLDIPNLPGFSDLLRAAVEELNAQGRSLKAAQVLDQHDVQAFMRSLTELLSKVPRNELEESLGDELLQSMGTVALTHRLRTARLSQAVMNLVYANTAIADYVAYAPWEFIEELLFTRSAPELLLGGTNPSMISLDYPQVERFRDGVSPRLLSYTRDLASTYSEEEITELLLKGLLAEFRLGRLQSRPYLFERK